jgi:hypothetical protein
MTTTDFLLADDFDLELNPETFIDAPTPLPVIPGTYRVRIESLKQRKNKAGEPVTRSSKLAPGRQFPVYVIEKAHIVEPTENDRDVMLFQDISLAPFMRGGSQPTSTLQDILRSYDVNIAFHTMNEGVQQWLDLVAQKQTFLAYVDWQAYDAEYAKAAIADAQALSAGDLAADVKNNIYNKAKVRGYKKFPKNASGTFSHIWTGPTGNQVEARATISRWLRSDEDKVVLGPVKDFRK